MSKRKWSPASNVNKGHLGTMLARGDEDYVNFIVAIFTAKANNDVESLEKLIDQGQELDYLPIDALEKVTGSRVSAVEVAKAAATNSARQTVFSLLQLNMADAVQALIDDPEQADVTEKSVAMWRDQLEAVKQ